ncbi:MAG TPA: helicase, partial [Actinomycetota bacterium]|nr:helicase [Actinomycetota bacterium]
MTHPEIKVEQAHIDHAYERLEVMRERARSLATGVLGESRGGTHQFRYTRDVIVENSYRRLASLTFGDEPLVFGRIDR